MTTRGFRRSLPISAAGARFVRIVALGLDPVFGPMLRLRRTSGRSRPIARHTQGRRDIMRSSTSNAVLELAALEEAPVVERPRFTTASEGRRPNPIAQVRVSVTIPTLNEAQNLPHVFARLPEGIHEVIIVDGRSTDGTPDVARSLRPDVRIVHQTGRGKGDALRTGFEAATGDIIAMLDADGSTDAAELPRFVSALLNGADFVKGSRFAQGGHSSDITL